MLDFPLKIGLSSIFRFSNCKRLDFMTDCQVFQTLPEKAYSHTLKGYAMIAGIAFLNA